MFSVNNLANNIRLIQMINKSLGQTGFLLIPENDSMQRYNNFHKVVFWVDIELVGSFSNCKWAGACLLFKVTDTFALACALYVHPKARDLCKQDDHIDLDGNGTNRMAQSNCVEWDTHINAPYDLCVAYDQKCIPNLQR